MEKKRLRYLDLAKGIGIILVVTGHSTYADTSLLRWLSSFHMPLFFIITGILLAFTGEEEKPFRVTVKTKAVRLLIPYGFFSVFYIISNIQILYKNNIPITLGSVSDYLYQTVTLYGISVLWFLTALFFGEILFLFVLKKWKITGTLLMTIAAVFITGFLCPMFQKYFSGSVIPWKILFYYLGIVVFRMFLAYIFIGAGYGFYRLSEKIKLGRAVNILLAIVFMAANIYLALSVQTVDMHFMVLGNIFLYLITAILGASSVILFCKGIDFEREKSLIGYLGKNSLIIMLTHMDFRFLSIAIKFSKSLYSLAGTAGIWLLYILIAIIMLILELICIWIINHYFGFLLGAGILKKGVITMILTVTMNPAIDKTYTTDGLMPGTVNRMKTSVNIPGGKGINVSRLLRLFHVPVTATGFLGGYNGKFIEDKCKEQGIICEFVKIKEETRSSINVIGDDGYVTEILEPGPGISDREKDAFIRNYKNLIKNAELVVIAGSVAKDMGEDFYKNLIEMAHLNHVKVFLDTSGDTLMHAVEAAPYLIKPNLKELEYLLGQQIKTEAQIKDAISIIHNKGVEKVVVSLGSKGIIYGDGKKFLKAKPPRTDAINTVGCGDSVVASYVLSYLDKEDDETALKRAVAISAAHATTMENGNLPLELIQEYMDKTEIKTI